MEGKDQSNPKADLQKLNDGPGGGGNSILCSSFNQDQGCFACGTETGFKIFNSFPYKDSHKRSKYIKTIIAI